MDFTLRQADLVCNGALGFDIFNCAESLVLVAKLRVTPASLRIQTPNPVGEHVK